MKWSQERKEKFSKLAKERGFGKWMLGRHMSEKTKNRMSRGHLGNRHHFYGKKLSEEHKRKLSFYHADFSNEKNPFWSGDKITKGGLHIWIRNKLGSTPQKCQHCNRIDKKRYEWCNIDHSYKRRISDWLRLCTSCHRKYDIIHNNYQVGFLHKI